MNNQNNALSVLQVTQVIMQIIGADDRLKNLWIEGEVSNFKRYPSGHAYFTLKDDKSQLKCVMWKNSIAKLAYIPNDGDRIKAHGRIDVYPESGLYQLYVDSLQPAGLGALYLQFERLKARLQAAGLFDAARKRPLPRFPRVIGVVTSPGTAAFQDIQNVLRRRYPLAEVRLSPTLVQGSMAPAQIVVAIEALAEYDDVDVILVARGGGSIEDLWAFNDEAVAYAIFGSPIPVVTGVGHEIDFTIVDFVADLRAPTPSVGAEVITPDSDALRDALDEFALRMENALARRVAAHRTAIEAQKRALRQASPQIMIDSARQRLDGLDSRLASATDRRIGAARDRLRAQSRSLTLANPENLFTRGYALVTRAGDNKRLTDAIDAAPGTGLTIRLARGELRAIVRERTLPANESTDTE